MTLGLGMVAQFLNLSTQEAEAGGSLRVSLPTLQRGKLWECFLKGMARDHSIVKQYNLTKRGKGA